MKFASTLLFISFLFFFSITGYTQEKTNQNTPKESKKKVEQSQNLSEETTKESQPGMTRWQMLKYDGVEE